MARGQSQLQGKSFSLVHASLLSVHTKHLRAFSQQNASLLMMPPNWGGNLSFKARPCSTWQSPSTARSLWLKAQSVWCIQAQRHILLSWLYSENKTVLMNYDFTSWDVIFCFKIKDAHGITNTNHLCCLVCVLQHSIISRMPRFHKYYYWCEILS